MNTQELFLQNGYGMVENSDSRVVYVKYLSDDMDMPKYKKPCIKIIFNLKENSIQIRGRNEKGNLACPAMSKKMMEIIYQYMNEIWC